MDALLRGGVVCELFSMMFLDKIDGPTDCRVRQRSQSYPVLFRKLRSIGAKQDQINRPSRRSWRNILLHPG